MGFQCRTLSRILLPVIGSSLLFFNSLAYGNPEKTQGNPVTIDLPAIPEELKTPTERADYLIEHYWDLLDVNDTGMTKDVPLIEQSLVNFLSILPFASSDTVVRQGFETILLRSAVDPSFSQLIRDLSTDYLIGSGSPMASDSQYITFLRARLNTDSLPEYERLRLEDTIEMMSRNLPGTSATDFSFETPDGTSHYLYDFLKEFQGQLLLIFFDPDCENCEETMRQLAGDKDVESDIKGGMLKIIAVYSGNNYDSWMKKVETFPSSWTVGINDGSIEEDDLYYFPSMPTIYLLDAEGTVIERNIKVNELKLH